MKPLHTKNSKICNFYLKIAMIFLLAITTGCFGLTKRLYEESTGKKSSLKFKLLDFDATHPMIYWIEGPNQTETALTLTPDFRNCNTTATLYVNPNENRSNKLTDRLLSIKPITLSNLKEEQSQWQYISDDDCSILVTAGNIVAENFQGISFSTPAGSFKTYNTSFQSDIAPTRSRMNLLLLPFGPYFDLAVSPVFPLVAASGPSRGPEEMTVSFKFPNGDHAKAKVIFEKAEKALKEYFPHLFNLGREESAFVRIWARAALLQLHLDFKEINTYRDLYEDPNWWHATRLISVGGFDGDWQFSIDDSDVKQWYLGTTIQNTVKEIRFFLPTQLFDLSIPAVIYSAQW